MLRLWLFLGSKRIGGCCLGFVSGVIGRFHNKIIINPSGDGSEGKIGGEMVIGGYNDLQ